MSRRRFNQCKARFVPTLIGALLVSSAALAGPIMPPGDGSAVDNDRLLPSPNPPAFDPLPLGTSLREPYDPFFDVDWSVSLRGAYVHDNDGMHYEAIIAPDVSLTHTGTRSAIKLDANAEVSQPVGGQVNLNALRLGLDAGYSIDSVTNVSGQANLAVTKAAASAPGVPSDVAIAPTTVTGSSNLALTRQFGLFNVGVTGGATRTAYGETTMVDASVVDNSDDDFWSLNSGLRVGFQATPVFEIFGEAGLERDLFDKPNSVLLVKTDATNTSLRGGIKGQWNSVLEAEVSAGVGVRRFDEASLGEVRSNLYDASLTFRPDETWTATSAFSTTVTPPGPMASGTTRIEYAATGSINRTVNSWLALRAQAGWRTATLEGSTDTESGYSYGFGADYKVNAHTAVTADYGFDHAETTADGPEDNQRITLGIRLSR